MIGAFVNNLREFIYYSVICSSVYFTINNLFSLYNDYSMLVKDILLFRCVLEMKVNKNVKDFLEG